VGMCENSSGLVRVPVVVEPVVVPVPPVIAEVQIADVLVATAVAVLYEMPSMPLPSVKAISRQSSELYFIWGLAYEAIPPAPHTRSFGFLGLHVSRCP